MKTARTKYQQICETFRRDILDGKYPPGTPFPSVVAVVRRFGISRLTAVKVIDLLKDEGLLRAPLVVRESTQRG